MSRGKASVVPALTGMVVLAGGCDCSETGGSPAKKDPSQEGAPAKAEGPTPVETVQVAYRETAAERTARISYEATTTGPSASPETSAGASSGAVTVKAAAPRTSPAPRRA